MDPKCPTCGERFHPRNYMRHRKACIARLRKLNARIEREHTKKK